MDAPNSNRLKSGFIVALYMLSLFVVAATPTAMAQDAPNVTVNFVDDETVNNWYDPGEGTLEYGTTRDVFFTNISKTAYSGVTSLAFFGPDQLTNTNTPTPDPTVAPENAACGESTVYDDPDHAGAVAGSFYNCELNQTGQWVAWGYDNTDSRVPNVVFRLNVTAVNDLNVALSPSSITYDLNQHTVTVTVTDEDTGNAVSGAKVTFLGSAKETGTNGKVTFGKSFANAGVGEYTVTATKNTAGNASSEPERMGNATFEVKAATLDLDDAVENPIQGFTSLLEYEISFPHNTTNVFNFTGSSWTDFTVKLTKDNTPEAWTNGSRSGSTLVAGDNTGVVSFFGVQHLVSDTTTTEDFPSGVTNVTRVNPSAGNLTFWNQWAAGTWKVEVFVDNTGDDDADWVFSRSFSPTAPDDMTVTVEPDTVDVNARSSGKADTESFTLQIFGDHEQEHPISLDEDNITVTGDYIGTPVFGNYNASGNGKITVSNITPTRGDGEISFVVSTEMDGESLTEEVTVQIDKGAVITQVSPETVTVETPTDVHVFVEDVFGNPIPDAKVELFWPTNGTTIATISGGGAPGEGQAGEYIFEDVNLTATGDVFAFAETGQTDKRYAYQEFEAVPAHDLEATVEPDTLLAGRAVDLFVNVTQQGQGTFDETSDLYVLSQDEWEDFVANGSSALPATAEVENEVDGNFTIQNFVRAAGTYHVYVRSDDGLHDIAVENVPTLEVNPAQAEINPDVLVKKIDKNQTVTVTVRGLDGELLNGTLAVVSQNVTLDSGYTGTSFNTATEDGTGGTISTNVLADSIEVENGVAEIENVTAKDTGTVWLYFEPTEANSQFALLDSQLEVKAPQINVQPADIFVGETNRITVTVTHPATGAPIEGATVTVEDKKSCGTGSELGNGTTGPQGKVTLSIFPTSSQKLFVCVNGDLAGTFTPVAGLSIEFLQTDVTAGESVTMVVRPRGAQGTVEGAQVFVDGQLVGETGLDGRITLGPFETAGTRTVKVTAAGFANATAQLTVQEAEEPAPTCKPVEMEVTDVTIQGLEEGEPLRVGKTYVVSGTVELTSPTDPECEPVTVQVKFQQAGVTTQVQQLQLEPGESEQVGFTWNPSQTGTITVGINGVTREVTVQDVQDKEPTVPGFSTLAAFAAFGAALVLLKQRRRFD